MSRSSTTKSFTYTPNFKTSQTFECFFKKRSYKRRNVLVSSFVGRLKVCTHTPNFKMSQTFECFFKKRSYKRRNVLVSRSSTTKSLHTLQTSKRRRLLNVTFLNQFPINKPYRISLFNTQSFAGVQDEPTVMTVGSQRPVPTSGLLNTYPKGRGNKKKPIQSTLYRF